VTAAALAWYDANSGQLVPLPNLNMLVAVAIRMAVRGEWRVVSGAVADCGGSAGCCG
jgi:hypothetical protein